MGNKKSINGVWSEMNNILKSFIITLILALVSVAIMLISLVNDYVAVGLIVFLFAWYFIYLFVNNLQK